MLQEYWASTVILYWNFFSVQYLTLDRFTDLLSFYILYGELLQISDLTSV